MDSTNFKDKNVLLRADFNVPFKRENGEKVITEYFRIDSVLPTIDHIVADDAQYLVICSHLGRPNSSQDKELSLDIVFEYLKKFYPEIKFIENWYKNDGSGLFDKLEEPGIYLLENLRFYGEEEQNDKAFGKYLSKGLDIYVNDAFSCCHRSHASIVSIDVPIKIPGFLLEQEIKAFDMFLNEPKKGKTVAILGGSKISDKIKVIEKIIPLIDYLIIGGGMAFTFLKDIKGVDIGNSLYQESYAQKLWYMAKENGVEIVLPSDWTIGKKTLFAEFTGEGIETIDNDIKEGFMGLDIGPTSLENFKKVLDGCSTIFWNGPMGVFEIEQFSLGTKGMIKLLEEKSDNWELDKESGQRFGCKVIVGGGDSTASLIKFGDPSKFFHVSTGGGASLEYLEGVMLPGIQHLL